MQTKENNSPPDNNDEEFIDTLIAISVIAKRLAVKLKEEHMTKEEKSNE